MMMMTGDCSCIAAVSLRCLENAALLLHNAALLLHNAASQSLVPSRRPRLCDDIAEVVVCEGGKHV